MTKTENAAVALWFVNATSGNTEVGLFASEADAADFAVHLDYETGGTSIGVEFSNGTLYWIHEWEEYDEARERADEREQEKDDPPPPDRVVYDPFYGNPVTVVRQTPGWVGTKTPLPGS